MPISVRGTLGKNASARGFTLIEVAVVMIVFVILLGMVGVRLTRDNTDILRDEAARLVVTLQNAQQQAILEGKPYIIGVTLRGYEFYKPNEKGRLESVAKDDSLAPRTLPNDITIAADGGADRSAFAKKNPDMIVFEPSGEFEPFTLVLQIRDISWYVRGNADGEIISSGQRTG